MTVQPTIEGFLAAARQALAGASPQQAMRALLDATVKALYARTGRWIEHDSDEMLLASSPAAYPLPAARSSRARDDRPIPGSGDELSYRRNGRALVRGKRHDYAAPYVAALPR